MCDDYLVLLIAVASLAGFMERQDATFHVPNDRRLLAACQSIVGAWIDIAANGERALEFTRFAETKLREYFGMEDDV